MLGNSNRNWGVHLFGKRTRTGGESEEADDHGRDVEVDDPIEHEAEPAGRGEGEVVRRRVTVLNGVELMLKLRFDTESPNRRETAEGATHLPKHRTPRWKNKYRMAFVPIDTFFLSSAVNQM